MTPSIPDPAVLASRLVREQILRLLSAADRSGAGFGFTFEQILHGYARARQEMSEAQLRGEMNDLVDGQLARRQWDEAMRCDIYAIAPRGRDFVRAGCPWERLDEFTGRQG